MSGSPWIWPPVPLLQITNPLANVESVFGRTGVVVAVDGDYTAAQITNDSSVPGGTVAEALDTIRNNYISAYLRPPASPNAFDDEFEDGSADLATRGYTVVNAATGVVQTRSGDISVYGSGPAAGTYQSTIVDSWIYIRAPDNIQIDIYKTIALAAGDTYFCRMAGTYGLTAAGGGRFNELGVYGASGAQLDNNNRVFATVRDDNSAAVLMYDCARITAGVVGGATSKQALGGHDIRIVHFVSGTTYLNSYLDTANGELKSAELTGAPAVATLTRVAMRNFFSTSGGNVPQIWGIDFIRKKTGNAWLIP